MAVPVRKGSSGSKKEKTPADDLSKAIKQVRTSTTRLDSSPKPQSGVLKAYANTGNQTVSEQKKAGKANPFEKIGGTLLAALNKPSQGVLRGVQNRDKGISGILQGVKQGLSTGAGDDSTNLRGAIITPMLAGKNASPEERARAEAFAEKQGGRVGGLFDLVGTAAIDPLSYVGGVGLTGKAGGAAGAGLKAVEKGAGKELAQQVAAKGARKLAPEQLDTVRTALANSDAAKNFKGGPDAYLKKMLGGEARFLGRESGALDQALGLRLGGKTVVSADKLGKAAKLTGAAKAAEVIGDTKAVQGLGRAFKPRYDVAKALGTDAADTLGLAVAGSKGRAAVAKDDVSRQLTTLAKAAEKAGENVATLQKTVFDPALETGSIRQAAASLRAEGREAAAKLADKLAEAKVGTREAERNTASALGKTAAATNAVRSPSKEFTKWVRDNPNEAKQLLPVDPQSAEFMAGKTIDEVNSQIERVTGVKKAFEPSASKAVLSRSVENIDKQARTALLEGMTKELPDGTPLAVKAGQKVPDGFVKVPGTNGQYLAHRTVAKEIARLDGKLKDPTQVQALLDQSAKATQLIKNYTLNAAPFFVGRVVRDAFGNQIAMWTKGFKNPKAYAVAIRSDKALRAAMKDGKSYEEAIASLPADLRKFEELMAQRGTVNSGQLRSDISHASDIALTKGERRKQKLTPTNAEAFGTKTGSSVNTFVDDISRRAMFIDQMWQHGDADVAAKAVKEALFDYGDLTDTEKGIRKVVWFYTFMARNLELQAWALANAPAKSVNAQRALETLLTDDDAGEGSILPQDQLNSGQNPVFTLGKIPIMGGIQTPLDAAAQALQPLADIGSYAAPEKYTTQAGWQGGVAGLLGQVGGAPGGLAKQLAEEASGSDIYTGAPLEKGKRETLQRFLESQLPRGTQYRKTAEDIEGGSDAERVARLLSTLGLSSTAVTDKRQLAEVLRRKRSIEESAERQKLPTVTALKNSKKTKAKDSPTKQQQTEALRKLLGK